MGKKKIISLCLALFVTLGLLTGCMNSGNKSANPNGNSSERPPAANNSSEGDYPDYSSGFPENVTLEIPVYERAFEGWNVTDNYYTRWIQKEFGDKYNVTLKYVPITRSNEVTDYEQLLASHKAPDIIFHYDMPQALAYYGEGVMQELNWDEIAHYAPTYWKNMGDTIKQYGAVDGENVFFFGERPSLDSFTALIRKDWVEKVGMKLEDLTSL